MKNDRLEGARQNKLRLKNKGKHWREGPRGVGQDLRGSLQLTQHWRAFQRKRRTKARTHTQRTQTMARTLWDATTAHQDSLPPHTPRAGRWFYVKRPLSPGIWQRQMLRIGSHTHAGLRWEQMGEGSPHTGTHPSVSKGERLHWSATWRSFYPHTHTHRLMNA